MLANNWGSSLRQKHEIKHAKTVAMQRCGGGAFQAEIWAGAKSPKPSVECTSLEYPKNREVSMTEAVNTRKNNEWESWKR